MARISSLKGGLFRSLSTGCGYWEYTEIRPDSLLYRLNTTLPVHTKAQGEFGDIRIPVDKPFVSIIQIIWMRWWFEANPVDRHPQLFCSPDLGKDLMHVWMLTIVPHGSMVIHLGHPIGAKRCTRSQSLGRSGDMPRKSNMA